MVGLQGSGKTTTTAKLARRLKEREGKRVLMASLDTRRPAAMEQLAILGAQVGVDTLPIVPGQDPVAIAKRARQQATLGGYDVVMLDTAGRLHVDDELMAEVAAVRDATKPHETLLVVDGLTGQDAVNVAEQFDGRVGVSGVILTRMDGDGRGGAALSMRAVTGKPIKFVGLGEKLDALEEFHPDRIAGRILGMGDIVALVEKAQETLEAEAAERMMKRFQKGQFNMNDLKGQLQQMQKMGGMQGVMGMLPGMAKMSKQMDEAGLDDRMLRRQIALIDSMTKKERRTPDLLQASRKRRIAAGAGLDVQELNRLLKMHRQMADVMKKMGGMGKKGLHARRPRRALRQGRAGMPPGMPAPARPARCPRAWRCRPASPGSAARNDPDAHHRAAGAARARGRRLRAVRGASTSRARSAYEGGPLSRDGGLEGVRHRRRRLGAARLRPALGSRTARRRAISARSASTTSPPTPSPRSAGWSCAAAEGRGIAAEAARALRDWAYAAQGWTTLVSYIDPENARSIRLAERLGARLDPDAPHPDGRPCLVYRHPGPEARA